MQRLLGSAEDLGKLLGLDKDWAYRAVKRRRQLRRDVRAQRRRRSRRCKLPRGAQQPVEQGRADVRAAAALSRTGRQRDDAAAPAGGGAARSPPPGDGAGPPAAAGDDATPGADADAGAGWHASPDGGGPPGGATVARRVGGAGGRRRRARLLAGWFASNALDALRARGVRAGFDFLLDPAGFQIGEGWVDFEAGQPFWRAFVAGLANTVRVALPAIALATLLGLVHRHRPAVAPRAAARHSRAVYVEALRNVPLLLQLLMCTSRSPSCCPRPAAPSSRCRACS